MSFCVKGSWLYWRRVIVQHIYFNALSCYIFLNIWVGFGRMLPEMAHVMIPKGTTLKYVGQGQLDFPSWLFTLYFMMQEMQLEVNHSCSVGLTNFLKILWERANLGSKAVHDRLGVVFFRRVCHLQEVWHVAASQRHHWLSMPSHWDRRRHPNSAWHSQCTSFHCKTC